jgi:hypothetical protein
MTGGEDARKLENAGVVWALSLVNNMARLGVIDNTIEARARYLDAALSVFGPAALRSLAQNEGGQK